MNDVLKKCVAELSLENPRLDYIRGMLDTLLVMTEVPTQATIQKQVKAVLAEPINVPVVPSENIDEAAILDAQARSAIEKVKEIAKMSE